MDETIRSTAAPDDVAAAGAANRSVASRNKVTFVASLPKLDQKPNGTGMPENQGKSPVVTCLFEDDVRQRSSLQYFSLTVMWILWFSYYPLKFTGFLIEWMLNFLSQNGGLFGLLFRVSILEWGRIKFPHPDGDDYYSCVGHLDPRNNLYVDDSEAGKAHSTEGNAQIFPFEHIGARSTADVCVMAAKLAYENKAVIKKVVEQTWKMHFVGFWNCWNEHQKMANTQVFMFTDKPVDANAVVVAWRGTEPFNAYDWITDLDFHWVKFSNHMGIHMGFLEALGLGNRKDKQTFKAMGMNAAMKRQKIAIQEYWEAESQEAAHIPGTPRAPLTPHHKSKQEIQKTKPTSGLPEDIVQEKDLAYDIITKTVCKILLDNPNAKVFITGHSLGGALATLYATMLHCSGETEMTSKIAAVYTFGQPRVGDMGFANYARRKFDSRYYRVVYCNDMVARVPFDSNRCGVDNDKEPYEDQVFAYKHFGKCAYFNSVYDGKLTRDPPNRNFFGYPGIFVMPLTAVWELYQSLMIMTTKYGTEYKETIASIMFRVLGLLLPGVAAHSPCNYVNSVRLGRNFPLAEQLADDVADSAADAVRDVLFVSEDFQDIYKSMSSVPGKDNWKLALEKIRENLWSEHPLQTHASAHSHLTADLTSIQGPVQQL